MHQNKKQKEYEEHIPVLLGEVLQYLNPKAEESYLDLTAGYAGHAEAVVEKTHAPQRAVLVDRDENSIKVLKDKFSDTDIDLRQMDFLSAAKALQAEGKKFDMILADLGVSSPHLNENRRGFSLQVSGPLDMRMDQSQKLTADKVVNTYSLEQLTDILVRYGEEPKARQIARTIIEARPITDTTQLAEIASQAWPGYSRVHPATRTFQAIRIAVNDELNQLEQALPIWLDLLKPQGRLAVISFHSLEDRMVKQAFKEACGERYDADHILLTKRPITASSNEIVFNPRARSAKLRVCKRK
jgi:16S rRNA (cytosine1402-N4)-methyltransferase